MALQQFGLGRFWPDSGASQTPKKRKPSTPFSCPWEGCNQCYTYPKALESHCRVMGGPHLRAWNAQEEKKDREEASVLSFMRALLHDFLEPVRRFVQKGEPA